MTVPKQNAMMKMLVEDSCFEPTDPINNSAKHIYFLSEKAKYPHTSHCVAQVTSRQFIGDPIDCMSDSMSSGIMDIYCWIHSTYSVNGK